MGFIDGVKCIIGILLSRIKCSRFRNLIVEYNDLVAIINQGILTIRKDAKVITFSTGVKTRITCRRFSSDLEVLKQIYLRDELRDLILEVKRRKLSVRNIIDIGSNIGLSVLKLNNEFPFATIVAVEPDVDNFSMLKINTEQNSIKAVCENLGIWSESKRLYFDTSFRDGKEWSISLTETFNGNGFIDAISLNDLISNNKLETIDILKIDIEGGERMIFNKEKKGLEFLNNTKVLALEIHDEFNIRSFIVDCLKEKNFSLSESGEYLLAINESLA